MMQKVVIDTNCLISYVTDRNLKQQEIVSSVLEQAASLKICIYCHFHVISEFIFVLGFKNHYKIKLGASGYRFV
ncbi:MAG: hypothetical protein U9Q89_00975, partial [Thermodesulfobacteriota bacterium]|nr:hypothetical protein [Thermodesulfobacteriota bacterium]